jgi:hypothetical protein
VILVERSVLAVLYFATSGEGWLYDQHKILSTLSICEWNNGQIQASFEFRGALCNEDYLVIVLILCMSTHEEVPVLISNYALTPLFPCHSI